MPDQSSPAIAILTIGNELLDGRVRDTNASTLADLLRARGFVIESIATVNDDARAIKDALSFLFSRTTCVLVSGGLGPTSDDLTRDAVAEFFGVPLQRDPNVAAHLERFFAARKRTMNATNLRQADFPLGAEVLPNAQGTAPGFTLCRASHNQRIFCLPGVPHELLHMCTAEVLPLLSKYFQSLTPQVTGMLKIFGRTESDVAAAIERIVLPERLHVGYRASFPEVHLTFVSPCGDSESVHAALNEARAAIGSEYVFTEDPEESIEALLVKQLKATGHTLTCAESCTGGMIAGRITSVAGASEVFHGSIVSYQNQVKVDQLGVSASILDRHGAVSAECAEAMARGALDKFLATYALAVTGIAGPSGGSVEKPVGTFYVALATNDSCQAFRYFFMGSRGRIRTYAATTALDVIRRALAGHPLRNGTPS
ncbi:MAG: CinA family nicotinamide mononucleotide deamidase-related protein [Bdellovibrionota bacterium]|nr:MAG: CinA family nicotinamide mononucleotide deamidase-related protein [Bdellovibrionota bacterium]